MPLTPIALALIGMVLAAWTVAAAWAIVRARGRERRAEASQRLVLKLSRMIDESPALPLLVHGDGRIEGSPRLAAWLGLDALPGYLSELDRGDAGLDPAQLETLGEALRRTQRTAAPFRLVLSPRGSSRSLALRGLPADPGVGEAGGTLVWVFDVTEGDAEVQRLRAETAATEARFAGLSGLIEAAPLPMWFRGADLNLMLVNTAYVAAVAGESAEAVIAGQIELIEPGDGASAMDIARQARAQGRAATRTVTATVAGQRRMMHVSDVPLAEGVAGYAIDGEDLEEQTRAFRAFRHAQRRMLDALSAGIAQFDAARRLTFANQPFLRLFGLTADLAGTAPEFDRLLEAIRDNGRLPTVRDFPEWRRERQAWFTADIPAEESWLLADNTHLRIIAQPMPDAGLLLIVDDRTEQLHLAATRDTLLRTRTAMLDNLFEALAVFAPDGRLQLWNRRFIEVWDLDDGFLDDHPHVDPLLERLAGRLQRPSQIEVVGAVIRSATLERSRKRGLLTLANGRFLEFAGVPLPDGNGLLTVLDVTDSRNVEAALRERNAALVEADAGKTRFIASLAYAFRAPLTSVGGFAELLQDGVAGELSERGAEYVAAILGAVLELGERIDNILDLAPSEAGALPFARAPVELRSLCRDVLAGRRDHAGQIGVTLDLRGFDPEVTIEGDARRLTRAIAQLVDNAVTAAPPGSTVAVETVRRGRGGARITVSDQGEGMGPAALALASAGKPLDVGRYGFGLPLARRVIEAHGGTLELRSEPGRGTLAIVLLP